jgi:DnaJ-class molecular chaperone
MPVLDDQSAEWKHAYQVLGVPRYASAHAIKAAYRKLVKRWHPDLYTPAHRSTPKRRG